MKRTAFFISDGTGITAETLGQSLLSQFENIEFRKLLRPYVDTVEKARDMVQQINAAAEADGQRPIIFETVVNRAIHDELAKSQGYIIDIFSTFLAPLEQELGAGSSYSVASPTPSSTTATIRTASMPCTSPWITMTGQGPTITRKRTSFWWGSPGAAKRRPASIWHCSTVSARPTTP